ncbi:MAG: chorismate mutase [Pseudomonadota bacterium]
MKDPKDCMSMEELRVAIDAYDKELMAALARRAKYIDRAVDLKRENGWPARIPGRVEEVAMNARKNAEALGYDPDFAEAIWRQMIDWSIAREERAMTTDRGEIDGSDAD